MGALDDLIKRTEETEPTAQAEQPKTPTPDIQTEVGPIPGGEVSAFDALTVPKISFSDRVKAIGGIATDRARKIMSTPNMVGEILFPPEVVPQTTFGREPFTATLSNINSGLKTLVEGTETMLRVPYAGMVGAIGALGEIVDQFSGEQPGAVKGPGARLERDLNGLLEIAGLATMTFGPGRRTVTGTSGKAPVRLNIPKMRRMEDIQASVRETQKLLVNNLTADIKNKAERELAQLELNRAVLHSETEAISEAGNRVTHAELRTTPIDIVKPTLDPKLEAKIVANATEYLQTRVPGMGEVSPSRISDVVVDLLATDQLSFGEVFEAMGVSGVTPVELATYLAQSRSEAGRTLQRYSALQQKLRNVAKVGTKSEREAAAAFDTMGEAMKQASRAGYEKSLLDEATLGGRWWHRVQNRYRGSLIGQLATAVRNFETQIGRTGLDVINRSVDKSLQKIFRPDLKETSEPIAAFGEMLRMFNVTPWGKLGPRQTKKQIDELIAAMPAAMGQEVTDRLFTRFSADYIARKSTNTSMVGAAHDSVIAFMNIANTFQEKLTRRAVMAAQLDRTLATRGTSMAQILERGGEIRLPELRKAIEKAQDLTFARTPSIHSAKTGERVAANVIKLVNDLPGGPLFATFPRFFYNALKTINDHMPTGMLKLLNAEEKAKMAAGDFTTIARSITGSTTLGVAHLIRKGQIPGITPGEKWNEVITSDGKVVDLTSYSPLVVPLFMVDFTHRLADGRISLDNTSDILKSARALTEGLMGGIPSSEFGIAAVEEAASLIAGLSNPEQAMKLQFNFTSKLGAAFLTPFRQINDYLQEFDSVYAKVSSASTRPSDQLKRNLPFGPTGFFGTMEPLPNFESPTRAEDIVSPRIELPFSLGTISAGVVKQFTGLNIREPKNIVEKELDYLGITQRELSPRIGKRQVVRTNSGEEVGLNQLLSRFMGPALEIMGGVVFSGEGYNELKSPIAKQVVARMVINQSRKIALDMLDQVSPEGAAIRRVLKIPKAQRRLLELMLKVDNKDFGDLESFVYGVLRKETENIR